MGLNSGFKGLIKSIFFFSCSSLHTIRFLLMKRRSNNYRPTLNYDNIKMVTKEKRFELIDL